MRDISNKADTLRTATATAILRTCEMSIARIRDASVPKGDVLASARIAGIQAAKRTPEWLPFCHTLPIDYAEIESELGNTRITFKATIRTIWKTGVEMEALTAASAAALSAYDMLKPIDRNLTIEEVQLCKKTGGKSQMSTTGKGVRAAVLVVSDSTTAGTRADTAGAYIRQHLEAQQAEVVAFKTVADEREQIRNTLKAWAAEGLSLILTTGGTGMGPRDVTPEAALDTIDRTLPGISEAVRAYGQRRTPFSMISRAVAGVSGKTVIVTLPGSQRAVEESLNVLFPALFHAMPVLEGEGH